MCRLVQFNPHSPSKIIWLFKRDACTASKQVLASPPARQTARKKEGTRMGGQLYRETGTQNGGIAVNRPTMTLKTLNPKTLQP